MQEEEDFFPQLNSPFSPEGSISLSCGQFLGDENREKL